MLPIVLLSQAFALPPFVSGSDGSDGDIFVAAGTSLEYTLPDDGRILATTVSVESGAVLTFTRNAGNTPVQLLATGDVDIAGTVSLDGDDVSTSAGSEGGPGGFRGGASASQPNPGAGPYGGVGSSVGTSADNAVNPTFDPSLLTLIGGSGGGGRSGSSCAGSGGGGAILIASEGTLTLDGTITANAGGIAPSAGCGSQIAGRGADGTIRLVAPVITGGGSTDAALVRVDAAVFTGASEIDSSGNIGRMLYVIPPSDMPRVRFVSVGAEAVPDTGSTAFVTLPNGSAATQDVVVEVEGFGSAPQSVFVRASRPN